MDTFDFIVVGGGIAGASAGFELSPHGKVLLLDRAAHECARYVDGARRLGADQAREMVPALRADHLAGAVFDPEAMDIDVHSVHYGFLRGIRSRGSKTSTDAELLGIERAHAGW